MGLNPSHQLTEDIIHENQLPEYIGNRWRDLARALTFNQANIDAIEKDKGSCIKECCITVLVRWMGREGRDATIGKLADALKKIELKNVADKLMCVDADQNDDIYMQTNCEGCKMRLKIKDLEEKLQKFQEVKRECSKLGARNLELEEELSNERQQGSEMRGRIKELEEQLQDSKQECSKLHAKILEVEEDLASERQQHQHLSQEGVKISMDVTKEDISPDATKDDLVTDQEARERLISIQLRNLNEKLENKVTSPLQVREVKEDKLKTSVKLDLLAKLSVSLQEMYSETLTMVAEACKCNEDLKRDFYDFAYHGLRAEHNDLVPRVEDLELSQADMSDEEKKEFERLKQLQINRQRQVDRLEKLWRGLFTSRELPQASSSVPSKGSGKSKKASSRKSDPGARHKFVEPPPTSDDGVRLEFKQSAVKSLFTRKESKENTCFTVSYTHRDS
ncbi:hypothetical protein ACROYT_G011474 [Oculina patagonica]